MRLPDARIRALFSIIPVLEIALETSAMAAVVRLGDAAAAAAATLGSGERAYKAYHHSQSCQLQSSISWRPNSQKIGTNLACHGNLLRKGTQAELPFRAMALPLDRKSVDDGSEPSVAEDAELELEEPWVGAIVFKRSNLRSHYEFQTSLERLGIGFLSTESSRALAISMGLGSAGTSAAAPATEEGTPVNISIDVSRDDVSRDLRLDGIARTAMCLCCNRCLSPVMERVYSSFNLLLTEKPVVEPTQLRLGVVLGENGPEDEGPELDLDLDDKIHFPREVKEIDLSKYIRDSVHLEIPYKSLCSIQCAGLCLTCGVNLNERTCNCTDVNVRPSWGPLEQLRKQLKDEEGLQ